MMEPWKKILSEALDREGQAERQANQQRYKLSKEQAEDLLGQVRKAYGSESGTEHRTTESQARTESTWSSSVRIWWKHAAISTAALAAIIMFLSMFSSTGTYTGQIDPFERGSTNNLLPLRLSVDFKTSKIVLRNGGLELSGALTPLATESSSSTNVYQLDMGGKDSDGRIVTMTNGRAHFILKTPGGVIKGKGDTTRARLEGRLDVAGVGNFPVRRTYLP